MSFCDILDFKEIRFIFTTTKFLRDALIIEMVCFPRAQPKTLVYVSEMLCEASAEIGNE